jgi:DNA-binding response OmpR family regulator
MSALILVVEDDAVVLKAMEFSLKAEGYQILSARDSVAALKVLKKQTPDLMILDISLIMDSGISGIADGFSFLGWMRYSIGAKPFPVIIHTADRSRNIEQHAREHGAYAVIRKGTGYKELMETVRKALAERSNSKPPEAQPPAAN